jgi:serine/threonine-protein kinase
VEDEDFLEMFLDEARIAASLNHPNLVQIFELGEANGSTYLAMEYVPGEDLRRVERRARTQGLGLPVGIALRIIADAAAGLHYAHQARDGKGQPLSLVHRDVSPQNILVGFSGAVKLIDFGVAKAAGRSQQTASGVLKGKFPYLSPEQAAGKPIDHRSDQFALGIVLWETLTGQRLFKDESDLATLRRVQECHVPAPSSIDPAIPQALDAIVLRALSKSVDARFKDCGAFRLALEELAMSQAIPASSAHLTAFMSELYADRIATETSPQSLDELSSSGQLDDLPTPTRPTQAGREKTVASRPGRGPTQAAPRPTQRGRGGTLALVAVAVLAIAGTVAWVAHGRAAGSTPPVTAGDASQAVPSARPPGTGTAAPPGETHLAPPLPVLAPPTSVTLRTHPPGAEVEVDGQSLGRTPLTLSLTKDAPQSATLRLSGYEPLTTTVSADQAPTRTVTLERKPPAHHTAPLRIKTGR